MDIHYPKKFHHIDSEFQVLCDQAIPLCDKNKTKKLMATFYDKKYITSHVKILFRKRIKTKKNTLFDIC